MRIRIFIFLVILVVAACAVPPLISFQGVLKDGAGSPITGTRDLTFRICDSAVGGSVLWYETQTVSVESGLYSVQLGSVRPMTFGEIFNGDARYLAILVGTDPELVPRVMMLAVPYAYRAEIADYADSSGSSGVSNAVAFCPPTVQSASSANAIWLRSASAGSAVLIESGSGTAISGIARNAGSGFGGLFKSNAVNGAGGTFYAKGNTGMGIYARAGQTGNYANYGGFLAAAGQQGRGLSGYASNTIGQNLGGQFTASGDKGIGVYGTGPAAGGSFESTSGHAIEANAPSGYGVSGESVNAAGVYGISSAGNGVYGNSINNLGVYGESVNAAGVYGYSTNGNGVYGETTSGSIGKAISASAGTNGYSGFFEGGKGVKVVSTAEAKSLVVTDWFTPTTSTDARGEVGTMVWDANYIYIKVAPSTWRRTNILSTWP